MVATWRVRALDASTWPAFAQLVEQCDGFPSGCWCMGFHPEGLAKTDDLPRIKSRAVYERTMTTLPDWRIACCYSAKGYRRQGVAHAALEGALQMIAALGGGRVEGYPEPAGAVPAGFLYNGALSTYEQLGFRRDRLIGKHRWVVSTVVEASE